MKKTTGKLTPGKLRRMRAQAKRNAMVEVGISPVAWGLLRTPTVWQRDKKKTQKLGIVKHKHRLTD